jgi:EAL domain-containing protein (putative c-di-GMP-specific phosphodiesterase class I)
VISQLFPDSDSDLTLSINISPMQLISDAFVTQLTEAAARYQIANHRITLEITENVLINDMPKVKPIIEQLKELGFTISLDDFGTGYSSLSYLSHLTLDEIKVDRLFIDKMLNSEQSDSLVKAIIAIARSSDMRVVAEGVETEAQRQKLQEYGCDILQGYLIERPISAQLLAEKYATPDK